MSPYRRPALRYIVPESLRTPFLRKIKFAWHRANNKNSLFSFIYLPIAIVCLLSEWQVIFTIGIIVLAILAIMLWF